MSDVEIITKEFQDIFCHYKQNQNRSLLQVFNDICTSECSHKARTRDIQSKMNWCGRTASFYQLFLSFILVVIFATYGMFLIRHYNYASIFGGCLTSYLWSFEECPVAY